MKHTARSIVEEMYNELTMSNIEISADIEESFALCVSNDVKHIQWIDMMRTIEQDPVVRKDDVLRARIMWWIRVYQNNNVSMMRYIWRSILLVFFCSVIPVITGYFMIYGIRGIATAIDQDWRDTYIAFTIMSFFFGMVASVVSWINAKRFYWWVKKAKPDNHHKKEVS